MVKRLVLFLIVLVVAGSLYYFLHRTKSPGEELCLGCTPCKYDSLIAPAKILRIDTSGSYADMLVAVLPPGKFDSISPGRFPDTIRFRQYYSGEVVSTADIIKARLKKNDLIKCILYHEISGTCSPFMYSLFLEKFMR
jgi:hypothetical protein